MITISLVVRTYGCAASCAYKLDPELDTLDMLEILIYPAIKPITMI